MRMLGEGRPFVMEIMNQRAEVPGPEYFAGVEERLKAVGSAVCMHDKSANSCVACFDGPKHDAVGVALWNAPQKACEHGSLP